MTDRPRPFDVPSLTLLLARRLLGAALLIELADELVDGATGAAWPLVRSDLSLSYLQVGLLLGVPAILANLIEPALGLLADAGHRRRLVLAGGVCFALSLLLTAAAPGFWPLLLAWILFYPASGAFVSLTQAALMDADPARREQNMARWALAGSVGNVAGPLLVGATVALGLGWRPAFALLALLSGAALLVVWRSRTLLDDDRVPDDAGGGGLREGWLGLLAQLRRARVRGALLLLECSNLMLDVFRGFVALYFVDAAGASATTAGLAVAVLTGVGLLGDVLVVPVLERVSGVAYVRASAAVMALLLPVFLIAPPLWAKLALVGVLGLLGAGWYAVLQARLYALVPDRSGTVMAMSAVAGLLGGIVPIVLGLIAQRLGVQAAMWVLLAGPLALLLGLPRRESDPIP